MGISGAKMAQIYDDTTDEYVDINLISQDSQFQIEGIGERDLNGNELWFEDRAELSLAFFDDSDLPKLKAWQRNRTPLKVTVVGIDDFIFWNESSTFVIKEPTSFKPRQRNMRVLKMSARGAGLQIDRQQGYTIMDEKKNTIDGFYSVDLNLSDGSEVMNLLPATFGPLGSVSWTIDGTTYNMETIILNTN